MRIIYADILFVLNVYITYGLLLLTSLISKTSAKKFRLLLASLISGLYSFIILVPDISNTAVSLSRIPVCFLLMLVSFGVKKRRHFFRLTVSFLFVNVAFAGLMFALWYFFSPMNMYYNGGIVYFNIDAKGLVVLTAVCYCVLKVIYKVVSLKAPVNTVYDMCIFHKDREFHGRAFLDTGNSLREPFSDVPVIVANRKILDGFFPENIYDSDFISENKIRFIVCKSVGGDGLLPVFMPQKVRISSLGSTFETGSVAIAVTDKKLKNGEFDGILPPELFIDQKIERGDIYAFKHF